VKIRVYGITAEGEMRSWDVSFLPGGGWEVPMGAIVCSIEYLEED
jgi:hypothetical protein